MRGKPSLRRGGRGASAAIVVLMVGASCGADEAGMAGRAPSAPAGAGEEGLAGTPVGAPREASPPALIAGAAVQPVAADAPDDVTPLGSRFRPRPLAIPRVQPGRSASFVVDGERRGWVARLPEHARTSLLTPAYGRGRVYLGGGFASSRFYALDARTGATDWITAASDGGPTAAILEGERVLFNTESCTLFVVDADTGRLQWKRWLGDPVMGQPAAAGGKVFSGHIRDGGQGYGMTALRLSDGTPAWTRNITADVMNAPVLDDESLYFTTMDGVVWRLDQARGRVIWKQRLGATSAPWLHGGTVHVARRLAVRGETASGRPRQVRKEQSVVLAKADGALVREHEPVEAPFVGPRPDAGGVQAGWQYEGSRPTIVDGRAYQTIGNEVQSRDADTGELLWRRRYTESASVRPATPPAIAGSQLLFGTKDGVLYGLDIDTGLTTFAYDVGEPIGAQPTVAHGWVYAATTTGGVVGIELEDPTIDGWHMWGGDAKHNGPVPHSPEQARAHATAPDAERPTEGTLRLPAEPGEGELPGFPLKGTSVEARVSGFVARVRVRQTFANPYERPVEAVYLFPLPDDAAVDAMELRTGTRVVRGQIRRREEARREYRQARDRGVLASLLEQERPNLFRQSVANVRPGDEVEVVLDYTQVLPYEEGSYRLVFPMVAGPRYVPDDAEEGSDEATSGVRQVALPPGQRRQDRVEVRIEADLGVALHGVTSPTHALRVEDRGPSSARVHLGEGGVPPEKDLDVRFSVAGDVPSLGVVASPPAEGADGFLTLMLHPRLSVPEGEVAKRELVFLVDASSSMHGRPMALAKAAMERALEGLRAGDTFRVVGFSDGASALSERALPATAANVERAKRWVRQLRALGRTEMTRGVRAALDPAEDPDRMRVVLLLTDGYIGNETEVFREVHDRLGHARLFAFGVGSAVNRYLLTRLAEVGRGDVQVVTLDESPEAAADAFHARIGSPYVTDVTVDWGQLPVSGVYPRRAPDLFGDRPLVVHGRYGAGGEGTVTVRGRIAGRAFERRLSVSLPSAEAERRREVESVWARRAIRDRMLAMALAPSAALEEEVTALGLRHGLLTRWTAFVAVDEGYRTDGAGQPPRVDQPSTLPTGVDFGGDARVQSSGGMVMGSLSGTGMGYGGLGLGGAGAYGSASGYGRGGGGTGEGTIGLGAVGVIGHGAGSGGGLGVNGPRQAAGGVVERVVQPSVEQPSAPTVSGALDRSAVLPTLQGARARFRDAYADALRADPTLHGRVVLELVIGPDGAVRDARLGSDEIGSPVLTARLLAIARSLRFPEPAGGAEIRVSYPLIFASG